MPRGRGAETEVSFRKAAKRIGAFLDAMEKEHIPQGLRQIGEEILTDVKASSTGHGVPVDQGILRASGIVEQEQPLEITISFGGAGIDYAIVQHENLFYRHRIGEARYLVRGVERWRADGSQAMRALRQNAAEAVALQSRLL